MLKTNNLRLENPLTWPHQGAILDNNVPFQICNGPFQISNGPQLWLVKLRASLCIKRIAGWIQMYLSSHQPSAKYEDTTKTKCMTGLMDKVIVTVNQNELDWLMIWEFFSTQFILLYFVSKNNRLFS
jgi:hypothetical protein